MILHRILLSYPQIYDQYNYTISKTHHKRNIHFRKNHKGIQLLTNWKYEIIETIKTLIKKKKFAALICGGKLSHFPLRYSCKLIFFTHILFLLGKYPKYDLQNRRKMRL